MNKLLKETIIFIITIFFSLSLAYAEPKKRSESYYQKKLQNIYGGEIEVRTKTGRRCDWVYDNIAWEIDFARKWPEGYAQAKIYGQQLDKLGGLIIILKSKRDFKYWKELQEFVRHYGSSVQIRYIKGYEENINESTTPMTSFDEINLK